MGRYDFISFKLNEGRACSFKYKMYNLEQLECFVYAEQNFMKNCRFTLILVKTENPQKKDKAAPSIKSYLIYFIQINCFEINN